MKAINRVDSFDEDKFLIRSIKVDKSNDVEIDKFLVNSIANNESKKKEYKLWKESILINDKIVTVMIDSGSQVNCLPYYLMKKIVKEEKIIKSSDTLEGYDGQKINHLGKCEFICRFQNKVNLETFYIVEDRCIPVLGLHTSENLKIIVRQKSICSVMGTNNESIKNKIVENYRDVFNGLGVFPKKYHIELNRDAIPIAKKPRRIPSKIYDRLKLVLQNLSEVGIVSKVENEAREWTHNLVIVEKKNGTLRVCLDPDELNKHIKKQQYLIPNVEDILNKLQGATFFSVLDIKDGFYHIDLDEESRKLCSFNTPFGVFQFNRMPFGIKSGPEIFQKFNEENFGDIENIIIYIDDLLIYAKSLEEHDEKLRLVLERARELNIKFNVNKFQFRKKSGIFGT